jgi:hypothetical protein
VSLAKLNAATEGKAGGTIAELIAAGMLPPAFGPRPDGSEAVIAKGEVYDRLRGRRGTFTPVPDVPIERISQAEEASYQRFANIYVEQWGRVEPIIAGIQRKSLEGNRDQVVIDVRMTPLSRQRLEFFKKWAGPADKTRLAVVPGDMAAFEAVLSNQRLLGGLRDVVPPVDTFDGRSFPWAGLQNIVVGYLGRLGQGGGLMAVLDMTFGGPADANGYTRNPLGLWRLDYNHFMLYSFQADVLSTVAGQLRFEDASRPAQLRMRIDDVSKARITPVLNNWGYARTRETAMGNLRLLHSLGQQFHIPAKDCLEAAEFLLGAKLVCPLGGQFVLRDASDGPSRWTTTKLEETTFPTGMPKARRRSTGSAGSILTPRCSRTFFRPTPRSSCSCPARKSETARTRTSPRIRTGRSRPAPR